MKDALFSFFFPFIVKITLLPLRVGLRLGDLGDLDVRCSRDRWACDFTLYCELFSSCRFIL